MLSRRSALLGSAMLVPAAPVIAKPAVLGRKNVWIVNPYLNLYDSRAEVHKDDIEKVEFIRFGMDTYPNNWLNVHTKKHGVIQTELFRHQNFIPMLADMKVAGVKIYVINVGEGNRVAPSAP